MPNMSMFRDEISNFGLSKIDSEQFDHNYSLASSSSYVDPIHNRKANVNLKRYASFTGQYI